MLENWADSESGSKYILSCHTTVKSLLTKNTYTFVVLSVVTSAMWRRVTW
jgi:hypothetical protein